MSRIANPWWASDASVHLLHATNRLTALGISRSAIPFNSSACLFLGRGRFPFVSDNIILSRSPCLTDKIKTLPNDLPVFPKRPDK